MMKSLLIVSDAWHPQINGVVRSIERTVEELHRMGVRVEVLSPADFYTVPCPTYSEIRLTLTTPAALRRRIEAGDFEHLHIATEGPLGLLAARVARGLGRAFTTSYHTRFPEYLSARVPVPVSWSYAWLRRFHNSGNGCMVATPSLERELRGRGFTNLMRWSRGVDHELFRPREGEPRPLQLENRAGPIFMYVGRVAVEKNITAFLDLDLSGTRVVVGDGPQLAELRARYPQVLFTGAKTGEELARCYAAADVVVFPSLTDTFGNVVLEALACGVPVAAYPVMGPQDILQGTGAGILDADLGQAALAALDISRTRCREVALTYRWEQSTRQFIENCNAAASSVAMPGAA